MQSLMFHLWNFLWSNILSNRSVNCPNRTFSSSKHLTTLYHHHYARFKKNYFKLILTKLFCPTFNRWYCMVIIKRFHWFTLCADQWNRFVYRQCRFYTLVEVYLTPGRTIRSRDSVTRLLFNQLLISRNQFTLAGPYEFC